MVNNFICCARTVMVAVTLLATPALASDPNPYGLTDTEVAFIANSDAAWAESREKKKHWRKGLKAFRLVTEVEPELSVTYKNATPVPVEIAPAYGRLVAHSATPPAIATLHDDKTGIPYSSCEAPCTLSLPPDRDAVLVVYRFGSEPREYPLNTFDKVRSTPNIIDRRVRSAACKRRVERGLASGDTLPPRICTKAAPQLAPKMVRSGQCEADIAVAPDGTPSPVKIACTETLFCEQVEAVIPSYDITPALEGGVAVAGRVSDSFNFVLRNERGDVIEAKDTLKACPL